MSALRRAPLALALAAALTLTPLAPAVAAGGANPSSASTVVAVVAPVVTGEMAVGRTLGVAETSLPVGADITYQWLSNGTPIAGATASRYTLTSAELGKVVEVRVTVTTADGVETGTSTRAQKVALAPTPKVSGTTVEGRALTASTGAWTSGTALRYQWLADGVAITGATASSYTPSGSLSGKRIAVRVTGTLAGYQTLTRTSVLTPTKVMAWSTPSISGTAAYGSTLSARPNTWSAGTTFTYQWYADGVAITGATGSTLKLGTAQKGKQIKVSVRGSQSGYPSVTKPSSSTARVATASTPTISGTAVAGATLTANRGTWTDSTTFTYQWYAAGVAISGATGRTYVVTSSQRDKKITVRVTGRRSGYATVAKYSAPTKYVQVAPVPTISGTPKVTYTLTANRGTWSSGTSFTYQWYASGYAISGATGSTFKLGSAQKGKTITVKVTGTKSGYPTVSRLSRATASVTYPTATLPYSDGSCPSWAPIKGNLNSMIYHMPWGAYYDRTFAERCFSTESAAQAEGFRRSSR